MRFSKLQRLYINSQLNENSFLNLEGDQLHYLKNVLRLKTADFIRIFNSNGEFIAQIIDIKKHFVELKIQNCIRCSTDENPMILGISLIKTDKMLDAICTAVQLGVTKIIPIISERSQIHNINYTRFNKCVIEATEQSERLTPPNIEQIVLLSEYKAKQDSDIIIYANEKENTSKLINTITPLLGKISLITGPEGGFSDRELDILSSWESSCSVSFGRNILRAETAVAAGLAQIQMVRSENFR